MSDVFSGVSHTGLPSLIVAYAQYPDGAAAASAAVPRTSVAVGGGRGCVEEGDGERSGADSEQLV